MWLWASLLHNLFIFSSLVIFIIGFAFSGQDLYIIIEWYTINNKYIIIFFNYNRFLLLKANSILEIENGLERKWREKRPAVSGTSVTLSTLSDRKYKIYLVNLIRLKIISVKLVKVTWYYYYTLVISSFAPIFPLLFIYYWGHW